MELNFAEASTSGVGKFTEVAAGVYRLGVVFVNIYAVEGPDGWVLVDTGLPGFAPWISRSLDAMYGPNARPTSIILTHGHFDHAGNAAALADLWDVPIYAHPQEMPYLTGESDYAPQDPTPGGALCFLSRFFTTKGRDLGGRVRTLPDENAVPALPGWRWIHTPGHTAGHTSLFREQDGVLIAGDACATLNLDSWSSQVTRERELSYPPIPLTPDWPAAQRSVAALADLNPQVLAAGHGLPLAGRFLTSELQNLARQMESPPPGRYSAQPATYAPDGALMDVPPPAEDPLPRQLAIGGALALAGLVAMGALKRFGGDEG